MLLTLPYLSADGGVLKLINPASASAAAAQAPDYEKDKPKALRFADPGLLAAQQAQEKIKTAPYLHLLGQMDNAQPAKVQLTKEEELAPYLSVLGSPTRTQKPADEKNKPKALGFADPGLLAAQQAQEKIKMAPYLHLLGQMDNAQPAKVQLTKDEELSPYLSIFGRPAETQPIDWVAEYDNLNRRIEYLILNSGHEDANGNIPNNTQELQKLMKIRDQIRDSIKPLVDMGGEGYNGNWDPEFNTLVDSLVKESSQGEKILDGLQFALDVAGLAPGPGELADGLNALISLLRGNNADAALSSVALMPFGGMAATIGKFAKKTIKGADTAETAAKYTDEVIGAGEALLKNSDEVTAEVESALKNLEDQIEKNWYNPTEPDILGVAPNAVAEGAGETVKFGSDAKSLDKLNRQMNSRGWTNDSVRGTVGDAFTTRKATNRATGNPATVYYNKDGSHVIIDDITNEVVQVSDIFDTNWRPDPSIVDPYKP